MTEIWFISDPNSLWLGVILTTWESGDEYSVKLKINIVVQVKVVHSNLF